MKTIVERLNELIDIKEGEAHGKTISECLGILNELESSASSTVYRDSEGSGETEESGETE